MRCHLCWCMWRGIRWRIPGQNPASRTLPSFVLKNTCVGISTTGIFSNLVKVVRTGTDENPYLELDFGDHGSTESNQLNDGE